MSELNQHEMLEMNLDEEEPLVGGGNQDFDRVNVNSPELKPRLILGSNRMAVMLLAIMFSIIIVLQVVLVVMIAVKDNKCACQIVSSNTDCSVTTQASSIEVPTCNNATEAYFSQLLMKMINGSTAEDILQLLNKLQAKDFQRDNVTKTIMENIYSEDSLLHIILNTLSNVKNLSISTSFVVDDILIGVNELLDVHNTSCSITPVSCKDIKEKLPNSPSGYYHVNNRDIYCNMDELCGSGGGWTRLAYLDMTDPTVDCPDELYYFESNWPKYTRMCGRYVSLQGSCSSPVKFPSNGISYSEICGRVLGYQLGSPDAVDTSNGPISAQTDLNSYYVDGVSLTRGFPRQHVWTFMAGPYENNYTIHNCPCNTPPGSSQQVQSFVGSHYFCESGNPATTYSWNTHDPYTSDPLWDGEGCGSQERECCNAPGLPWFHRQYNTTTTDSIEMRICGDEPSSDEDIPVSFYEIFVK